MYLCAPQNLQAAAIYTKDVGPLRFTVSPQLPEGLSLNAQSGLIHVRAHDEPMLVCTCTATLTRTHMHTHVHARAHTLTNKKLHHCSLPPLCPCMCWCIYAGAGKGRYSAMGGSGVRGERAGRRQANFLFLAPGNQRGEGSAG